MYKSIIINALLILMASCGKVSTADWIEGVREEDGRALHTLTLCNMPEESRVWFQELFEGKTSVEGPAMNH